MSYLVAHNDDFTAYLLFCPTCVLVICLAVNPPAVKAVFQSQNRLSRCNIALSPPGRCRPVSVIVKSMTRETNSSMSSKVYTV